MAVKKQWRNISEIMYLDPDRWENTKLVEITPEELWNIIVNSAEYCKVFRAYEPKNETDFLVKIGPFVYKVKGFHCDNVLKLLAENATGINRSLF